uniref:Transmembrane protein 14C n=1 Tax=Gallus gallus TaxID=9031 RepID=A0A8V0Y6R2_CHICK
GSAAPRSERAAGQRPPPCSGRQRGTADGVRLGWLRVRGVGRLRGHHRLRQGSVPSLAAGLLFGGLAGLGAYNQSKDPKNVWLSLVLGVVVGLPAHSWEAFVPQLQLLTVSLGPTPGDSYVSPLPVASGTLSAVMGMRFYNSRKAMPGLIAGASLLMVGRLGLQMMEKPLEP